MFSNYLLCKHEGIYVTTHSMSSHIIDGGTAMLRDYARLCDWCSYSIDVLHCMWVIVAIVSVMACIRSEDGIIGYGFVTQCQPDCCSSSRVGF